jgi:hypothetical protein
MTPEEKGRCFRMLDEYSRRNHKCFLAEMDLNVKRGVYTACFRPLGLSVDSPNRYACRYLYASVDDLTNAVHAGRPSQSVSAMLDRELKELSTLS